MTNARIRSGCGITFFACRSGMNRATHGRSLFASACYALVAAMLVTFAVELGGCAERVHYSSPEDEWKIAPDLGGGATTKTRTEDAHARGVLEACPGRAAGGAGELRDREPDLQPELGAESFLGRIVRRTGSVLRRARLLELSPAGRPRATPRGALRHRLERREDISHLDPGSGGWARLEDIAD